jgi:hypothetical protein
MRKSPLGHKIMILTSGSYAGPTLPAVFALVTGVGFKYRWDTPARSHLSPAGLLLDSSVAHELSYRPSRFDRILVLPDPDGEPACSDELGVAVAAADAAELQTPPTGVGLGQMTVVRAGVPETAVDEHRDPRPS